MSNNSEPSWVAQAAHSDITPDGLDLSELKAYHALRNIYTSYARGVIDAETGAREKRKILAALEREQNTVERYRKSTALHAKILHETEPLKAQIRKSDNPDPVAIRLCNVIDGLFLQSGGEPN